MTATDFLTYKALNFDLIVAKLRQHYSSAHHTKAYKDIKIFMKQNGFSHRQGSGYRSDRPMSDMEILDVVEKLYTQLPWFGRCVNKLDVTDVGSVYDLAKMYENYKAVQEPQIVVKGNEDMQPHTMTERLEEARQKAAAANKTQSATPTREKEQGR